MEDEYIPVTRWELTIVFRDGEILEQEIDGDSVESEVADAKRAFRGEYRSISAHKRTVAVSL